MIWMSYSCEWTSV